MKKRALDGALLPMIARLNAVAPRGAGAAARRQHPLARDGERGADRVREGRATVICVVNLDPFAAREGVCVVPVALGLPPAFEVRDLLTGGEFVWHGGRNYVRLDPGAGLLRALRGCHLDKMP